MVLLDIEIRTSNMFTSDYTQVVESFWHRCWMFTIYFEKQ